MKKSFITLGPAHLNHEIYAARSQAKIPEIVGSG